MPSLDPKALAGASANLQLFLKVSADVSPSSAIGAAASFEQEDFLYLSLISLSEILRQELKSIARRVPAELPENLRRLYQTFAYLHMGLKNSPDEVIHARAVAAITAWEIAILSKGD